MSWIRSAPTRTALPAAAMLAAAAITLAPTPAHAQHSLDDLVREGLRNNLALRQERIAEERSHAAVREARALRLPSLAFDARYSETTGGLDLGDLVNPAYRALNQLTGSTAFPTDLQARLPLTQETKLRVTQPIYNGAISGNHEIARGLRDLQGATFDAAARRLAHDIQQAYLGHATARRVVELYASTLALVEENVRVNESLLANGVLTPDAVHRSRTERSDVRQRLADAERQRAAAAEYLNFLLGRDLDAPVPHFHDSLLVQDGIPALDEMLATAIARREELRQVESGHRIASARERIARSSQLPVVALALDYGVQGADYRFGPDQDFVVASVVVQWNLFDGGRDAARRQQARLDAARASVQRDEVERQVAMQVRQAHHAAVVARDAIATADERVASARRSFELVSRRYDAGLAPLIEYIDARNALTGAELNRILTFYDYAARRVALEHAAALRDLQP